MLLCPNHLVKLIGQNCADFWRPGGDVDWTQVYDVPLEGQSALKKNLHVNH
jgi:hypothetical protein